MMYSKTWPKVKNQEWKLEDWIEERERERGRERERERETRDQRWDQNSHYLIAGKF